jgi:DNA polymerase III subunit gamma/tau
MAWYNEYRPKIFDDVIGQELAKSVLKNALSKKNLKHAYLFSGSKGIGKTTLARIFANQLNETEKTPEASIDIIEMDAASNTGIDDIRQLIESAKTPPLIGTHKIYIIDEVHMLSKSAMNALLKILEEPPKYIIFLLATTNPEKLLPTVLSRLTKLNLAAHTQSDIEKRLLHISTKENLKIDKEAISLIAARAGGSQRDGINLLETVASYGLDIYDISAVGKLLGLVPTEIFEQMLVSLQSQSVSKELIESLLSTGLDGETILVQLLEYTLDLSFEGEKKHDYIIPILSTILSLKLPINSIQQMLSLVMVYLTKNLQTSSRHNTPTEPKPETIPTISSVKFSNHPPSVSQKSSALPETDTPKNSPDSISSPDNSTENPQSLPVQKIAELNPREIPLTEAKSALENISKTSSIPPIVKMILPDLEVQNIENQLITLSVSNGIFLGQLQAAKIQSWFEEMLSKSLNSPIKIVCVQREQIADSLIDISFAEEPFVPEIPATPKPAEEKSESLKPQKKLASAGKIFYKVYRELPPEMKSSGVSVYSEEIPDPIHEKSHNESIADEEDDVFEFED